MVLTKRRHTKTQPLEERSLEERSLFQEEETEMPIKGLPTHYEALLVTPQQPITLIHNLLNVVP